MSNGNNNNTTPRQSSEDKAIMDEQGNEQRRLFYVEVDRQLSGADNTTKPNHLQQRRLTFASTLSVNIKVAYL